MDTSQDLSGFPEEVTEDVDGLMWLGYLEEEVEFCGHTFLLRTLRGDEELNAALVTKEYVETLGQAKAHVWSTIALSLIAVDGDENFCPPAGPDTKVYARARFNYLTSNWYWPTCAYLFERYSALMERQVEALQAVADLSRRSQRISTASADFSTAKADSTSEIMGLLEDEEQDPPSSNDGS